MGFSDLLIAPSAVPETIAEITADYSIPVERVFSLCNQLEIAEKRQKTRLVLEDAKAIISQILSETYPKVTRDSVGET
ncbi:hypothetical protein IQ243_19175 [Nostocales cyanobacterium LEGE 11386]|nr:hypothetical protein [Nostocales cyanobacterium LEGE 11386]